MRLVLAFVLSFVPTLLAVLPLAAQEAPAPAAAPPIRVIIEVPNDASGRAFVEKTLAGMKQP